VTDDDAGVPAPGDTRLCGRITLCVANSQIALQKLLKGLAFCDSAESDTASAFTQDAEHGSIWNGQHDATFGGSPVHAAIGV
jgi:hypothetical protein